MALLGANGAGKTTTLKVLSGLLRPQAGIIMFDGEPIDGCSPTKVVRRGIIQVPEGRALFREMNVIDNLLMGAYATPKAGRGMRLEQDASIFPRLPTAETVGGDALPGGEQQMVAIGRGLMADPKLLMLDEPSLGLAPLLVEEVFGVIKEINASGVTVLLVEQNTQHALSLSSRGYVLEAGPRRIFPAVGRRCWPMRMSARPILDCRVWDRRWLPPSYSFALTSTRRSPLGLWRGCLCLARRGGVRIRNPTWCAQHTEKTGTSGFDPEQINGTPGKAVGCPHSLAEPRKPALARRYDPDRRSAVVGMTTMGAGGGVGGGRS